MNHELQIGHTESGPETWLLTTEHPQSSYGVPVLVGPVGNASPFRQDTEVFGPADSGPIFVAACSAEALAALKQHGFPITEEFCGLRTQIQA